MKAEIIVLLILSASITLFSQSLEVKKQQLENLKTELEETENTIKETEDQKHKEQKELKNYQSKLNSSKQNLKKLDKNEQVTKRNISDQEKEIFEHIDAINSAKDEINKIFRGLMISEDRNDDHEIILLSILIEQACNHTMALISEKKEIEELKADLSKEYETILKKKKKENSNQSKYQSTLRNLSDKIEELEQTQVQYTEIYASLRQEAEALENLIKKLQVPSTEQSFTYAFTEDKILWPLHGKVLREFGNYRKNKITLISNGLDIEAKEGDEIKCVDDGVVAYSEWYNGAGKLIIINHKNGFHSLYSHSSKLLVSKGDEVKRGQSIALVGQTGTAEQSMLHFELRKDGKAVDPREFLD